MKIGILTQPLLSNYGGLLQNYALQQILISAGHEVETIDWRWKYSSFRNELSYIKWSLMAILHTEKYKAPEYIPSAKEDTIIRREFNYFINKYISHTTLITSSIGFDEQSNAGNYDAYVVGSDQCWRPRYNPFMPAMFLNFAKDKHVKRVAYAASFGTDKWEMTPEMTTFCASLAQKFDLVTVREDSGVKLCKDHLGVEATHVLDPTMLLSKEDYIHLIEAEKEPKSAGTLFNYILDPDETKTSFINRVAAEMKLKTFKILPKYQAETRTKEDVKKRIEDCVFPGVTAWLRAFMDAEMTIVDSFHGMVFSIIFNKPFWVIGNSKRGLSRFTSLLCSLGLENRLVDEKELCNIDVFSPVNWNIVNSILDEKRIFSKSMLLNKLK